MIERDDCAALDEAVRKTLTHVPVPLWITTSSGRDDPSIESSEIWVNDALDHLLNKAHRTEVMETLRELSDLSDTVAATISPDIIFDGQGYRPKVETTRHSNGSWAAVGWLLPVANSESKLGKELVDTLTRRSLVIDQKTGLMVRTTTERELRSEISRSRRYGNPLSVLVVEVEATADAEQSAQDKALLDLTRVLKENLRWVDILGAWDEKTAVVILPETDFAAAETLSGKLAARIEQVDNEHPDFHFRSGVAEWQQGDQPDSLIGRGRINADFTGEILGIN